MCVCRAGRPFEVFRWVLCAVRGHGRSNKRRPKCNPPDIRSFRGRVRFRCRNRVRNSFCRRGTNDSLRFGPSAGSSPTLRGGAGSCPCPSDPLRHTSRRCRNLRIQYRGCASPHPRGSSRHLRKKRHAGNEPLGLMDIAYIVPFSFQFGKRVITAFRRIDLAVPDCVKFTFGGSIAFWSL